MAAFVTPRLARRIATVACAAAAVLAVAWWAGLAEDAAPHAVKPQGTGRSGVAATAPATDFPWDASLGATAADGSGPAQDATPGTRSPFLQATGPIDPPPRPVWQMLQAYDGPAVDRPQADAAMLSALSWCENRAGLKERLDELREHDELSPGHQQALDDEQARVAQFCVRLSDRDYALRADILRLHARAGEVRAQLLFAQVGPAGRAWDGSPEGIALDSAQLALWREETLGYLREAARQQPAEALSALAFVHDPGFGAETGGLPGLARDPVEGHAYRLLWREFPNAVLGTHAIDAFLRREEARLTARQIAEARARAAVLASELSLQVPGS